MRFSVVSALIASAGLVAAAPTSEPGKREINVGGLGPGGAALGKTTSGAGKGAGDAVQSLFASAFGGADALLNTPVDFIEKMRSGKPLEAITGAVSSAMKFGSTIPGQVAKPFTDVGSGVGADVSKMAKPAAPKTN